MKPDPAPPPLRAVRSMTGFANVERRLDDGRAVSVRIRSVNARHLEVQVRLQGGMDAVEPELRARVRAAVHRGHVELTVQAERDGETSAVEVDSALLAGYARAYRQAAAQLGLDGAPDLQGILRLPGVLTHSGAAGFGPAAVAVLLAAVSEALCAFNEDRALEGAALAREMQAGAARIAAMEREAARLRQRVAVSAAGRLRARLAELVGESVEIGPERLLAEAAVLVARSDVEEELVRLRTHLARFAALLEGGGEVGKPLEFLLQELHREANTLLSKSGSAVGEDGLRLTELGLGMKVELERLREQVMNLE